MPSNIPATMVGPAADATDKINASNPIPFDKYTGDNKHESYGSDYL